MTPTQQWIVRYTLSGLSNEQISARLGISIGAVRSRLFRLYRLYGVHGRDQFIRELQERRIGHMEQVVAAAREQSAHCNCRCCVSMYDLLEGAGAYDE